MKPNIGNGDNGKVKYSFGEENKASNFVELLGTLDELIAHTGYLLSSIDFAQIKVQLTEIIYDLYHISGDISELKSQKYFDYKRIKLIEKWMDEIDSKLPKITRFVMPTGSKLAAYANLVRTVTRRSERAYFRVMADKPIDPEAAVYLNRLSDYFFSVFRFINNHYGAEDYFK
jgi:cob(I)alamin adenosyltransferase